jgi:hypothetical protein
MVEVPTERVNILFNNIPPFSEKEAIEAIRTRSPVNRDIVDHLINFLSGKRGR